MSGKVATGNLVIGRKDVTQHHPYNKTTPHLNVKPSASPTTQTSSASKAHSNEELLHKKRLVEQRLREKERRVSRLSMALGQSGRGSQRQSEVDKMADKLRKMQNLLEKSEQARLQEEAEDERRREEEKRLQRLTQELEKAVDPSSMTKSQKQRRTQNMMNLMRQMGGKITEEALEGLEAKEREKDEQEHKDRRERMENTEKRLK